MTKQAALLLNSDRVTRFFSRNIANWCKNIRKFPLEKVCNRAVTFKYAQGHQTCCCYKIGHISLLVGDLL